jgi:3-oxoacyl-[acyl-carrier-protein] synthase II
MRRRVVVTGYGVISPIGNNAAAVWDSVIHGRSGIATITRFETEGFETTFAGEVTGFDAAEIVGRKEARRMDRFTHYAVATALQAREHAGFGPNGHTFDAKRVGVLIGTGMGGVESMEQGVESLVTGGPRRVSPFIVPAMLPNMASGNVSIARRQRPFDR